jgi:hypothetical protein
MEGIEVLLVIFGAIPLYLGWILMTGGAGKEQRRTMNCGFWSIDRVIVAGGAYIVTFGVMLWLIQHR